jgi:HK97 family phage major capsid protein
VFGAGSAIAAGQGVTSCGNSGEWLPAVAGAACKRSVRDGPRELAREENPVYDPPCEHGYVSGSCAECRRAKAGEGLVERYDAEHRGKTRAQLDARREQCITRAAELGGYEHPSRAQRAEFDGLTAETIVIDGLIKADDVAVRRAQIEHGMAAMADPANREGPQDGSQPGAPHGAPALVKNPGISRIESAAEVVQRSGNPWRDEGGPLTRETSAGFVSRANTCIETVSDRLGHDGSELLATLLSERRDNAGYSVRRSQDEIRDGAAMIVALSSPFYESAMRHVFRNPDLFRTGLGQMVWSDDEREAVHAVMNNYLVRAAFAETSGAVGAFALPLQLSSELIYVNQGIASPHRTLARHELGTSNTWNGITTQGSTANVVAEGVAVTDTTPSIGQLVITPGKIMTWIFGSFESMDDTALSAQVPGMFDEARGRLEGQLFATGTGGSGQPFGTVTRAAVDATTGNPTAALIYAMDQNLPPRFRNGGKVAWASNETVRNICRQIPAFTGAVTSIVNDNTSDGIPEMLGYDFFESSAMLSGSVGNRELILGDWQSYVIVDRLPSVTIAEQLVQSQATALPTGQRGWLNYSRVGADTVTHNAA